MENVGRGTFVSEELPEEQSLVKFCRNADVEDTELQTQVPPRKLYSRRGRQFVSAGTLLPAYLDDLKPFRPGVPALDQFPVDIWSRLSRRRWRNVSADDLSYGSAEGCMQLREAIAEYVRVYRGVHCQAEQVVIVSGTQQAVDIVARLTIDADDEVLFENPGYTRARSAFQQAGAKIVPVPVDDCGMKVDYAISKSPKARLAYVTPSHQYPLGVTLPIERRMTLIEWANNTGGLIFEDDYDSEYRYAQRPIPALQGLDRGCRTIYVGSFSKVVFPSLSIGYAVVPQGLVEGFRKVLGLVGRPVLETRPTRVNRLYR